MAFSSFLCEYPVVWTYYPPLAKRPPPELSNITSLSSKFGGYNHYVALAKPEVTLWSGPPQAGSPGWSQQDSKFFIFGQKATSGGIHWFLKISHNFFDKGILMRRFVRKAEEFGLWPNRSRRWPLGQWPFWPRGHLPGSGPPPAANQLSWYFSSFSY